MNQKQKEAWEKLNNLYEQYPIKPKRYGYTTPSLSNAKLYDTPNCLRDWSKDKRKTNIPDYNNEEKQLEVTTTED